LIYGPTTAEEHDKILEEYLSAIRLKPDYAEAYFRLGMYYANQDKYKKGYEALNKAISLKPAYAEAYCGLGFVYIQKKFGDGHRLPLTEEETAMAVKVFKKAIEIRPDLLEAYVGLGQASLYRRQYNDALEAFQDAAAIDPNEIMSHVGMAAAFIELGDKDAALQEHVVLKRLASEYQAKMIEKGLDSFPNPAEPYADRLLKEIRERFPDK
jgi:tetratricopeptide (TPR) repeat protein